jgi:hypothetical protein
MTYSKVGLLQFTASEEPLTVHRTNIPPFGPIGLNPIDRSFGVPEGTAELTYGTTLVSSEHPVGADPVDVGLEFDAPLYRRILLMFAALEF